ncbi:hypothetical protein [Planococcus lenghuensis]|uniref:Uncharacterized protein n=1 Tax=Planococcus lenghuensis TaxID=2213202 RepID=A0A1Q2KYC7_9BACL|nr:hypothetical protein [Planococcus lenghuensis]AQQ53153.1 hypothetical protein B0X71_08655 [Planococcus lenghuensis]
MSLTSKLSGKTTRDKEFKDILLSVEPDREDYYTLSRNEPFSANYTIYVPNLLPNLYDAALVGTAFDYLARFRIAQFLEREDVVDHLVAALGLQKLKTAPDFNYDYLVLYDDWMRDITNFVLGRYESIANIYEIAVRLAKLEQLARANITTEQVDIPYVLFEQVPAEVMSDLENLMTVFEETFMIPEVITEDSTVVFNPNFGAASALVNGADADLFIDGTLYDFKTTKDWKLKKSDNLQMAGYYLLNELAIATHSAELGFRYTPMVIERTAFYRARFGEIEYYNISDRLAPVVDQKLKELAWHFKEDQGGLHLMWQADIETAQHLLAELREKQ